MKVGRHINLRRYNQIITAFARNGFGLLLDQLGLFSYLRMRRRMSKPEAEDAHLKLSTGERLRMTFEELGPAFVKLGQILSTRPDIFHQDIIDELKKLQDSVQPFPFEEAKALIEAELKDKPENLFKEFSDKPLAAASISQVHLARLNSGKQVAVKIQRPGIDKVISMDVSILKDLAHFIDNHTKYGKLYDFTTMAGE
ncbi:MAG: 2-octaprenylphenol hydroxylase, partial [Clostridiales bacterium]|nr:2-octaprenylphenol hydroxylase [Clostridiales bacterium]